MRQAYDYWQDQPGNYSSANAPVLPKGPTRPCLPIKKGFPPSVRKAGVSYTMIKLENRRTHKGHTSSTKAQRFPSISNFFSHLVPPISHISSSFLPVTDRNRPATQIMTFDEDYQRPATLRERLTVAADPRVVNAFRLGHRQLIHTLRTSQTRLRKGGI